MHQVSYALTLTSYEVRGVASFDPKKELPKFFFLSLAYNF